MDIKNTKELVTLLKAISIPVAKEIPKDGFQPSDLFSFMGSEEFKAAVGPAMENISLVIPEMKDVDIMESAELAKIGIDFIFDLYKALKAK